MAMASWGCRIVGSACLSVIGDSLVSTASDLPETEVCVVVSGQLPARPKHVVVVDAENPMAEVSGEFYWREDHEEIVAAARDAAYREGYAAGRSAAIATAPDLVRYRRPSRVRVLRLIGAVVMLAWIGALLMNIATR